MDKKEQDTLNKALIEASKSNDLKKIKLLVMNGADIETSNWEPFINAVVNGYLEIVKYFVEQGVNIHAEDIIGNNALFYAIYTGYLDVIKYLVEQGADNNKNNKTLDTIIMFGKLDVIKYFVTERGYSAEFVLELAKEKNQEKIVEWCEIYIKSKGLRDKLEIDLSKNADENNNKKMKV